MPTNDDLGLRIVPRYAPRTEPLEIPEERWDEAPTVCPRINRTWVSHIIGVLLALDQPDAWIGSAEEIDDARQQVNEIIAHFPVECGEDCMDCCQPTVPVLRRITSDLGMEISYDNGETWIQDPNDPRLTGTALPAPIPAGVSATRCDAATNGVEHLQDGIAAMSEALGAAASIPEIALAIATFIVALIFAPEAIPLILPLVAGLASAAFAIGQSAFDAAFTNDVWDDVLCSLWCNLNDDGVLDQAGYNQFVADIEANADPIVAGELGRLVKSMGLLGVNNACSYGNAAESDCSSCDCHSCAGQWELSYPENPIFGQFVELNQEEGWVKFSTDQINVDGKYYIDIRTPDEDTCCVIIDAVPDTGSATADVAFQDCGVAFSTILSTGIANGHCVHHLQAKNASGEPYTLIFYFEACPPE